MKVVPKPKQMWEGGPFRLFHEKPFTTGIMQTSGGYAGGYICCACLEAVAGVYRTADGWKCAGCRDTGKQAAQVAA